MSLDDVVWIFTGVVFTVITVCVVWILMVNSRRGEEHMTDHPTAFNFAAALGETEHTMIYTDNRLVGGNPDQLDGYWDTKEEAIVNFAVQFSEMAHTAQGHHLFVRRAPELVQANQFEGGTKWRMIGRFSIAKIKEKNT